MDWEPWENREAEGGAYLKGNLKEQVGDWELMGRASNSKEEDLEAREEQEISMGDCCARKNTESRGEELRDELSNEHPKMQL